jgi:hypothetical protein
MGFSLAKLFKGNTKDTLIFQVSEDFIEVAGVRRLEDEVNEDGLCHTELLYTHRMPRVKPAKKTLDDLAINMGKMANAAVSSRALHSAGFEIAEANIACLFVQPLSSEALITYSATLKKQTKVSNKLLTNVIKRGAVTRDELVDVPAEFAVYAEELHSVELNGYNTKNPLGKAARRVDVTVAKQLTQPALWSATGGVLEQTFHRQLRYLHKSEETPLDSMELCDEIYTGGELQEIANNIL